MNFSNHTVRIITGTVLLGVSLLLLWRVFYGVDLSLAFSLLLNVGYAPFLVALLPFSAIVFFDAVAWSRLIRLLDGRASAGRVALVRISAESLVIGVPGGLPLAESMKPLLLNRILGLSYPLGVSSVIIKKCFVGISQGLYTLLAGRR